MDDGFRADLVVEGKVIVEIKSVELIAPVHKKQVLTYIRLADKRLGLLINFGNALIKDGITRLVNNLYEGCAPRRKAAKNPSRFWLLASLRLCAKYYMRKKFALSIAILLSLLFAAASAQNRRSMAPADILRIASVREALMSSNAQWVAYTVASIE